MSSHTALIDDRRMSVRVPRLRSVHCPRSQRTQLLDRDRVLSAHRTSAGVATYLRCHCGGLVIEQPEGAIVHSAPHRPLALSRSSDGRER